MIGANEVLNDVVDIQLNGGTLQAGGDFDETVTNLTLGQHSTIDFNNRNSTIDFNGSGTLNGFNLSISNWDGTANTGGGNSQLIFDSTFSLTNVTINGNPNVMWINSLAQPGEWELVINTAPEASTWIGMGLLAACVVAFELRRRKR